MVLQSDNSENVPKYKDEWTYIRTKTRCPKCHADVIAEANEDRSIIVRYCSNDHCDYGFTDTRNLGKRI